jgi:hypothetical protein
MRTFSEIADEAKRICHCAYIGSGTRCVLNSLSEINSTNPNDTNNGVTAREIVNCFLDLTEVRWQGDDAKRIKDELQSMLNQ